MDISVIMLTYNREKLVGRAIESILSQTFQNFEFIIVDNGSTDQSGQIADKYAGQDSRIRVIHKERGNIGSGRNAGLDAAKGDFIAFIDDDDYTEPNYLEYLFNLAREYHADISVCGSWREIEGIRQPKYVFDGIYTYSGEDAVCEMLKREKFNVGTPAKLIARNLFDQLWYDCFNKYDDIWMTYKIISRSQKTVVSGIPLYMCTRHSNNNSSGTAQGETIPSGQIEEYLSAFRERTLWLTERFPDKADYWLYTELSYALSMYEKTYDNEIKDMLKKYVIHNIDNFKLANRFHTERDQMLLQKYKKEFVI